MITHRTGTSERTRRPWLIAATAWLALLWAAAPGASWARDATTTTGALAVIVAAGSHVRSIARADLRRCFLGSVTEVQGVRLIPLNHPPGSEARKLFDEAILRMSEHASQRYWIDSLIRDGRRAPRTAASVRLLTQVVKKVPGAITYVPLDTARDDAQLRVLPIDGAGPGDADYPLD